MLRSHPHSLLLFALLLLLAAQYTVSARASYCAAGTFLGQEVAYSAAVFSATDEFVVWVPNVNYNLANMTKKNLKTLCSVGPSGLPRAALEKIDV